MVANNCLIEPMIIIIKTIFIKDLTMLTLSKYTWSSFYVTAIYYAESKTEA